MKFEIRNAKNPDGRKERFYYVLIARNGEVMLTSEMMTQKQSCKKSIRSIKRSVGIFTKVVDTTLKPRGGGLSM